MHATTAPTDRLVGIKTVCEILERSRASIYRDIARGDLPKPQKLRGSSRWRMSDINKVVQEGYESAA